jgi:hypothetical protein
MTVYVLSAGCYSDRSIYGIFSSLEALEAGKAKFGQNHHDDWNDPEEHEVDEILSFERGPTWTCRIQLKTGKTDEYAKGESLRHPQRCEYSETTPGFYDPHVFVVSPISYKHACKVAIEKRQEWLRTNQATPATTELQS